MAKRYKSGLIGLGKKTRYFSRPGRNRWNKSEKWVPLLALAATLGLVLLLEWR